jgi:hypothetical protein
MGVKVYQRRCLLHRKMSVVLFWKCKLIKATLASTSWDVGNDKGRKQWLQRSSWHLLNLWCLTLGWNCTNNAPSITVYSFSSHRILKRKRKLGLVHVCSVVFASVRSGFCVMLRHRHKSIESERHYLNTGQAHTKQSQDGSLVIVSHQQRVVLWK